MSLVNVLAHSKVKDDDINKAYLECNYLDIYLKEKEISEQKLYYNLNG
jgi:hypothetical protein